MTIMAQTIARLEAGKADLGLRLVAGAAEFAALQGPPARHLQPAAYVMPTTDRAERSELVGAHRQRVFHGLAVVLALGNLQDPRGQGASVAMEILELAVQLRLGGWKPDGAMQAMQFAGARTVGLRDQVVWRQLDFTVPIKLQP